MTREQFIKKVTAELSNLRERCPERTAWMTGPSANQFRVVHLKNGYRALVLAPVGEVSFELDWRSKTPGKITLGFDLRGNGHFRNVATIPAY